MDTLNLPQYERIDRVRAARITGWAYIDHDNSDAVLSLECGQTVEVKGDFMEWNGPQVGDYFVIGSNNHRFTMRKLTFERRYGAKLDMKPIGLEELESLASMQPQAVVAVKRMEAEPVEPVLPMETLTKMVLNKGAE